MHYANQYKNNRNKYFCDLALLISHHLGMVMRKIEEEVFTRVMTTVGFLQSVCHIVSLSKPLLTCKSGFMSDISSLTLLSADWHNVFI